MTELNKILKNETENPFHSYLLISSSSKYLMEQSKLFSSSLLFDENQITKKDIVMASYIDTKFKNLSYE